MEKDYGQKEITERLIKEDELDLMVAGEEARLNRKLRLIAILATIAMVLVAIAGIASLQTFILRPLAAPGRLVK